MNLELVSYEIRESYVHFVFRVQQLSVPPEYSPLYHVWNLQFPNALQLGTYIDNEVMKAAVEYNKSLDEKREKEKVEEIERLENRLRELKGTPK
jgi:hypothetical protein